MTVPRPSLLWSLMLAAGLLPATAHAEMKPCNGYTLPFNAKKLSEDPATCRFSSSQNWDETLKALERNLSSYKRHREVNIPAAKYIHLESTNPKTGWEGINVYQLGEANSDVRLFVIPRPPPPKEPKPAKTAEKTAKEKADKQGKEKNKKSKGKKK